MKIIISPAKTMVNDNDDFLSSSIPFFLNKSLLIRKILKSFSLDELKDLYACNDGIALLNYQRLKEYNENSLLTPAIYSYQGIQYKHIAPKTLDNNSLYYLNEHLLIVSGLYGLLKPFDLIYPYRLEMQTNLSVDNKNNLYEFWNKPFNDYLDNENELIINLASLEYSKAIIPTLKKAKVINIVFNEHNKDKYVSRSTQCKKGRGAMVNYLARLKITTINDIKNFDHPDYYFNKELSTDNELVFTKKK